ncbi:MAG: hypothetical protein WDN23_19790 [Edaphobacter sp.]
MRWEFFKQSINLLHDASVARQTGPNPIWLTTLPLSQTTFPEIPENYKNFEPRFGFAYNPPMMQGLVIRGGFAINYDPAYYNIFLNAYTVCSYRQYRNYYLQRHDSKLPALGRHDECAGS